MNGRKLIEAFHNILYIHVEISSFCYNTHVEKNVNLFLAAELARNYRKSRSIKNIYRAICFWKKKKSENLVSWFIGFAIVLYFAPSCSYSYIVSYFSKICPVFPIFQKWVTFSKKNIHFRIYLFEATFIQRIAYH